MVSNIPQQVDHLVLLAFILADEADIIDNLKQFTV
jgi:hypothetical protein